ncbi:MAG: ribonuclease III [Chloroflexi bacterium]|nr:ribonuclease III [Chloroflexota bacterium]
MLQQAFVHRSYLNENPGFPLSSNERLEFLGDAVLGFVVAEYLYEKFPSMSEGELTGLRAALVRAETLARVASTLELGEYLLLGRGEAATGGRGRQTILSRTLESLIGALFLDRGLERAKSFILSSLQSELQRIQEQKLAKDYKSRLQELTQAKWQLTPTYRTISAVGPDHAKVFTVEVVTGDRILAQGSGTSKQEAQQNAARSALESWVD